MSPAELGWRARDKAVQTLWSRRQVTDEPAGATTPIPPGARTFEAVLRADVAGQVPAQARCELLAAADRLMAGQWEFLGVNRADMVAPDWFRDPVTGRRASATEYAFRINPRSELQTGNVKQIWEISRLHHLTVLGAAHFVSGNDAYASRAAGQLRSWWRENPFLTGVNWTSGIEIGIRLIAMVWLRRLLVGWSGASGLFEENELAVRQIWWHQQFLAGFTSRGSSANNHVIAEAAGQLVASCAFPWFPESSRWRGDSARLLVRELARNTFPSGINRELASGYQSFVAELALLAAVEAEAAGHPLGAATWARACAMVDSGAALLDECLRPPRQGDGDDGRALLLDAPAENPWPSLLALGGAVFGRLPWWPDVPGDARSTVTAALLGGMPDVPDRPAARPSHFADAGITVLRTAAEREPEVWCRCDGGPHGYLSIAAHAHADALSVEVRCGGVDILADPGTYCYHGEPAWRSYFRSTIAHNTVQLENRNQSAEGGPFLWLTHARTRVLEVEDIGDAAEWMAEHDGYVSARSRALHRRCVRLDRASRTLDIVDEVGARAAGLRLCFHLGPLVNAELTGSVAYLDWPQAAQAAPGTARLELPGSLQWSLHRGETDPILGWYSPGLGRRVPACTLVGWNRVAPAGPLSTRLEFLDAGHRACHSFTQRAVSSAPSDAHVHMAK